MGEDQEKRMSEVGQESLNMAIRLACEKRIGVLDTNFLCQSLSALNPRTPHTVTRERTVQEVMKLFQDKRIGSVLVVNDGDGKLCGIFTERDFVLKVLANFPANQSDAIERHMTPNPTAQTPDTTVAFALNMMSHGGFRHIPLVDGDGIPIGIVSVRDVVDYIAGTLVEDLLGFETEGF